MNLAKLPELNDNKIKFLTLINIRWVAIFGQFATISIVYFYLNFSFNIGYCYLLVLLSSILNIFLQIRSKKTDLLSNKQATFSILYDLFQLFGLLFLTGGLTNPFSILIVAPSTIAAGFLNPRSSILIGFLSIVAIIILSFFYFELPGLENNYLFPKFYILGLALALCTTIIFLAVYSQRLAMESTQRNEAFNVLQQIFLREQELKSLGGLAAAAAHELGTPLNTISLVAKELKKEVNFITVDTFKGTEDEELHQNIVGAFNGDIFYEFIDNTTLSKNYGTFDIIKDSRLSEFIGTFYESNIANHDYINYLEERELKSQKDIDEKFDELTLDDLYSVLTLYIRQDRFVEGKLVALAENGTLNKLVQRITELKAH